MTEQDKYWLAGILEGEGSFLPSSKKYYTQISVDMTDEDIIQRVARLIGSKVYKIYNSRHIKNRWKPSYRCLVRGTKAIKIMKEVYPIMGVRRKTRIDECIKSQLIITPKRG